MAANGDIDLLSCLEMLTLGCLEALQGTAALGSIPGEAAPERSSSDGAGVTRTLVVT